MSGVDSAENEAWNNSANHPLEGHEGAKMSLERWPCWKALFAANLDGLSFARYEMAFGDLALLI